MYDVAIIGAGVIGASIFRELTKYNLNVIVIEKENDVSMGTSKANSAIVHAGYDPKEGTLMAKYNVKGNKMFDKICKELHVPFKRNGSLVLAFNNDDLITINTLFKNGEKNGVKGLKILNKEETLKMEPNINSEVKGALFAPTGGVFIIKTKDNKEYKSKYVINAAGVYADKIHNMICKEKFKIKPRKGEYYVMDKDVGNFVNHTVFPCPSKLGKGILITPTVHGNLLIGPNASDINDKESLKTTNEGLENIRENATHTCSKLDFRKCIRTFAGLRAVSDKDDFIIGEDKEVRGFIDVAGIKSPGLTSAPAIAEDMINILADAGLKLNKKDNFNRNREIINFMELSVDKKKELIQKDSRYGRIICRCEGITEGEIVDAINRSFGSITLDGVKRRCRPGMGRCQGGCCGPRVQEIIAKELKLKMEDILLEKDGSTILFGRTK